MNSKRKGSRNEHRSIAILEAAGYRCTRSAASLGEWDIVGIGSTDVVLGSGEDTRLARQCRDGDTARIYGATEYTQAYSSLATPAAIAGYEGDPMKITSNPHRISHRARRGGQQVTAGQLLGEGERLILKSISRQARQMSPSKKQRSFSFSARHRNATPEHQWQWPHIVMADQQRYGHSMVELACRFLHRTGQPHPPELCPRCQEQKRDAA
jgi:hypothetical protein